MFERFTDRARRVVVLAQEEARLLDHNYIGTEHILLGMLHEDEGVAARALKNLGISLTAVQQEVAAIIGRGASAPTGHIPFTPRAKKVLELSLREALQLGHNYIGTEHVLLGLIREGEGVGAQVLVKLGADLSRVRDEVISVLSGYTVASSEPARRGVGERREGEGPHTPATLRAARAARALAGERPVGTHHMLRAIVADEQSLAAKALAALGVTGEALAAKLAALDTAGTTDELPEEAGARRTTLEIRDGRVAVIIEDEELASLFNATAAREPFLLRSGQPGSESFPRLWRDVTRHVAEVASRLRLTEAERWRPPEWEKGWSVAAYAVFNHPSGIRSAMDVAEGVDWDTVRTALAAWLNARETLDKEDAVYLAVFIDRDADGDLIFRLHTGGHPSWPPTPAYHLAAHAILDLTEPPAA